MLKAVLYKIWSRPLILTVFLLICLAQPVSVLLHHQENMRQLCEYYSAWGGPMDDDWKQSIAAQYERLWPQPPKTAAGLCGSNQRAMICFRWIWVPWNR